MISDCLGDKTEVPFTRFCEELPWPKIYFGEVTFPLDGFDGLRGTSATFCCYVSVELVRPFGFFLIKRPTFVCSFPDERGVGLGELSPVRLRIDPAKMIEQFDSL